MANGDTKTESYLRVAAEGTRADLPTDTCCNTKTQNLILGVANRIMDVEDEVEELKNNPDVADIVSTYADLQNYDTSKLTDKDIIRVLQDETHDGDSTYYRYSTSTGEFTYVGESKQYTDFVGTDGTSAGESGLVPAPAATDTDKFLKSDGTWDTVEAGPTVVQTTGTSTTDVMSQNATTGMVFADPSTRTQVQIGSGSSVGSSRNVSIGQNATASNTNTLAVGSYAWTNAPSATAVGDGTIAGGVGSTAIGYLAAAGTNQYSVALGAQSSTSRNGEVNVGASSGHGYNSTNYRVIGGVHDPVDSHDAATKGYVDTLVGNIESALHAINNGGNA